MRDSDPLLWSVYLSQPPAPIRPETRSLLCLQRRNLKWRLFGYHYYQPQYSTTTYHHQPALLNQDPWKIYERFITYEFRKIISGLSIELQNERPCNWSIMLLALNNNYPVSVSPCTESLNRGKSRNEKPGQYFCSTLPFHLWFKFACFHYLLFECKSSFHNVSNI